MRLLAFALHGEVSHGIEHDGMVIDLPSAMADLGEVEPPRTLDELLRLGHRGLEIARKIERLHQSGTVDASASIDAVRILAPLASPRQMIFAGMNYPENFTDGAKPGDIPPIFAKWSSTIIGTGDEIVLPRQSTKVDFEAEVGVVIAETARNVSVEDAPDVIAGYVAVNDVSARDLHLEQRHLAYGKNFRTFTPLGPYVHVPDDPRPVPELPVRLALNGRQMQSSTTASMVRSIAELVSFLSEALDLLPGDLVSTGTPGGTGYFCEPQVFLSPGDVIEMDMGPMGVLRNRVAASQH